jgi:hypothetical protein
MQTKRGKIPAKTLQNPVKLEETMAKSKTSNGNYMETKRNNALILGVL